MSQTSTGLSKEERGAGAFRPLTITANTASALSGISPSKIWLMIKAGDLPVTRVGGRTLIHYDAFEALVLKPDGVDAPKRKMPVNRRTAAKAAAKAAAEAATAA
jgi:excisionase family DNA binding protein